MSVWSKFDHQFRRLGAFFQILILMTLKIRSMSQKLNIFSAVSNKHLSRLELQGWRHVNIYLFDSPIAWYWAKSYMLTRVNLLKIQCAFICSCWKYGPKRPWAKFAIGRNIKSSKIRTVIGIFPASANANVSNHNWSCWYIQFISSNQVVAFSP